MRLSRIRWQPAEPGMTSDKLIDGRLDESLGKKRGQEKGTRQAAPFSKGGPKKPGRNRGKAHGRKGHNSYRLTT